MIFRMPVERERLGSWSICYTLKCHEPHGHSLMNLKNTVIPYHTSKCQLTIYTKQKTNETDPKVLCTKLAQNISYQHPESPNRIVGFCCTQVALLKDLVHILSRSGLAIDAVDLPARSVPVLARFERDLRYF